MPMSFADWVGLLTTLFVLAVVPGSTDAVIVARSLQSGFAAGLRMTLGVVLADVVFVLVALMGLQLLISALGPLFMALRVIMALWLLSLGVAIWRSRGQPIAVHSGNVSSNDGLQGFLLTLADPKAIVFYMGLLPAFMNMDPVHIPDFFALLLAVTLGVGSVKLMYAALAAKAATWLAQGAALRWLQAGSAVMIWLCAALLVLKPLWAEGR